MTGRPETLEAALAWLHSSAGLSSIHIGGAGVSVATCGTFSTADIRNGDIPAAIVEAVGQVWGQVHGETPKDKCAMCGGEFPKDELHYGPDPYSAEICDDFTETVLCGT